MNSYSLSHLGDEALLRDLTALVARDRATTAELLAHLAEVDDRKLYLPAAYPSMYDYCVGELRMSEDAACKRIRTARAARQFPAIFAAVADGRLHLSAVVMLAPHLTKENADELLAAAAHQSKSEIEQLLARRFPRPDLPTVLKAVGSTPAPTPLLQGSTGTTESSAPGRIDSRVQPTKLTPLAPERFAVQFTADRGMHEDLQYAQALLGHAVPSGDVVQVFARALKALIQQLERQKFAATTRPGRSGQASSNPRHIPAHLKRAVWERDGGQCTFVSEIGRRCPARKLLEFDHVEEVARGGRASVGGIRLRCRAHNQFGAECTFGTEFMRHKRREAQAQRARARAHAAESVTQLAPERVETPAPRRLDQSAPARIEAPARRQNVQADERDVIPWLRKLGYGAGEARRAALQCESIPDASLEERVRLALSCLRPPHRRVDREGRST